MRSRISFIALILAICCAASTAASELAAEERKGVPLTAPVLIEPYRTPETVMMNKGAKGRSADLRADDMFSADARRTFKFLKKEKTTESIELITIHEGMLREGVVGTFNLPGLDSLEVSNSDVMKTATGLTWSGSIGDAGGEAILNVEGSDVSGTLRIQGDLYYVRSLGSGISALVKVKQDAFPPDHPPRPEPKEDAPEASRMDAPPADSPEKCSMSDEPQEVSTLKVLVAVTTAAREYLENRGTSPSALVNVAVRETNLGFQNSKVSARVELAKLIDVDYPERGSFVDHVERFAKKGDGVMDEVHAIRDETKADVCVLLIKGSAFCGYAREIDAGADDAFAVVSQKCATGYYSFAHEIGHLLAARHDPARDSSSRPFANGHGFLDGDGRFRTIMAYDCDAPCPRKPNWSNPTVKLLESPTGTHDRHYNACVVNRRAPIAATFR